jgi:hypothetical protein
VKNIRADNTRPKEFNEMDYPPPGPPV